MGVADAIPPPPPVHPTELDFAKGLKWSVWAHIVVFIFLILQALVFPDRVVPIPPTLRVDIVGLPDLLKNDRLRAGKSASNEELEKALQKAEQQVKKIKPVAKEVEKADPDEMVIKPKATADKSATDRQKRLKSAMARMKALSKIQVDPDDKPAQPIKGNLISKGTSLSGDAREAAEASYFDLIRDSLQEHWALPVWIARMDLSAQVQIFIDSRGRLHGIRFVKHSGNSQFDEAVKRTIVESQPYSLPPAGIAQSVLVDGILVGFPL